MPANSKYLTTSPLQRILRISAGVIGGYIITALIHMVSALLLPWHKEVLALSIVIYFPIWAIFLFIPFFRKNGLTTWLYYLIIILLLYTIYYWADTHLNLLYA